MSAELCTQLYDPPTETQYDLMDLEEEIEIKPKKKEPWARMLSKSPDIPPTELNDSPEIEGRLNSHTLGRSAQCEVKFTNSIRISNKHCVIFCKYNKVDPAHPYLEAWIEDLSANGTFINKNTRLKKNVPRKLHSGDEIYLINPEQPKVAGNPVTESEIAMNSFLFMLYLPSAAAPGSSKLMGSNTLSRAINDAMVTRTSTVVRLLGQGRDIHEFYEIKELLGTGTSGRVFHGVCKETGKDWAIKTMDTRKLAMEANNSPDDLTKEAEMLRSLRHPGIIHLEDIFSDGHDLHLVMELSDGGDLFDRVSFKGHYLEHEAKEVTRQIVEAIKYLHDNKVAHRDLKPENILLVSRKNDTHVKITDFGLAKKVDEASGGMKTFCGTPQYFAPEVASRKNTVKGQGRYSIEADMWSVGVILFVLLCGAFPFQEKGLFTHIKKAAYSFASPIWASVSEDAKDLIRKLLVVSAKDRLTAGQTLEHPWLSGIHTTTNSSSSSVVLPPSPSPTGANKRKKGEIVTPVSASPAKKKQPASAVAGSAHVIERYFNKKDPEAVDLSSMEGETTLEGSGSSSGVVTKRDSVMDVEAAVDLSASSRCSTIEDYARIKHADSLESLGSSGATLALSKVDLGDNVSRPSSEGSVAGGGDSAVPAKKGRKAAIKPAAKPKVSAAAARKAATLEKANSLEMETEAAAAATDEAPPAVRRRVTRSKD